MSGRTKSNKGSNYCVACRRRSRLALSETEAQILQSTAEEKIIETDIELAKATLDGVLAQLAKEEVLLEDKAIL